MRRVFLLDTFEPNGYPAIATTLNRAGRLVTAPGTRQPRYVVTAPGVKIDGRLLASTPRLALYQVSSPLRLADRSSGITGDGWTGADAKYTRYSPGAKVVLVNLSRPELPVAAQSRTDRAHLQRARPPASGLDRAQRRGKDVPLPGSLGSVLGADPRRADLLAGRFRHRRHPRARSASEDQGAAPVTSKARTLLGKGRRRISRTFSTDEERGVTAEHWGEDARERAESEDWLGLYWQSYVLTRGTSTGTSPATRAKTGSTSRSAASSRSASTSR